MHRSGTRFAAALLLVVLAVACATPGPGYEIENSGTRPIPSATALADWLHRQAGSHAEMSEFFIQMADPQLGMYATPFLLALVGRTLNDDEFEVDARLFEAAIAHANELQPAFVVICGDLINRVGHAGQLAEFRRIAGTLDPAIPLHLVAGNHDVGNKPSVESLNAYREALGPDWYSFRHGDTWGIVLNSQLIDAPKGVPRESDRQLAWLRAELVQAKESDVEHIFIFQHHPYFLSSPDESKSYFNIEPETRALYFKLFKDAGVEAVFAGHYHRNAQAWDGEIEMITTGPVGKPIGDGVSGFRIVKVSRDAIRHEYFGLLGR